MVPFGLSVRLWAAMSPEAGTNTRSDDAVPDRSVQLDEIWSNSAWSRQVYAVRSKCWPLSHSMVVKPRCRAA